MRVPSYINPTMMERTEALLSQPIKVCMHVIGSARTDVRVMREAAALAEAGYAVSIVDIEGQAHQIKQEVFQGIRLNHIFVSDAFLTTRFAKWTLVRAALILIRGIMYLIREPADIYHAHDISGLIPCYIAALVRQKPLIFDAHEMPLTDMSIHTPWFLALLSYFLMYIIPRCAAVITVSPPIAQEIHRRYPGPEVSLIRNTPPYKAVPKSDRLRQHLGLDPEIQIALFQGLIIDERGLDLLIPAAKFLKPGIVIIIMGKDAEGLVPWLETLAVSEGVTDRVKIIPPVPYAELLDWTASADIGLIIYRPNHSLNIKLCLPNKLFEYLMVGLPVLVSQLDAVADVIKTYNIGQILPSLTPEAIGEAINTMLSDRSAYECMRQNALEAAQKDLCWEKERKTLIQLYHKILGTQKTLSML